MHIHVTAVLLGVAAAAGYGTAPIPPGEAFNLTGWRLHTCRKSPETVEGSALVMYASDNFFLGEDGNNRGSVMVMRAPDNASYITPHATHPRTELREIGVADWPMSGGNGKSLVHHLAVKMAVQKVSNTSGEVIIAQIHGAVDEEIAKVLKLRWLHGHVAARVKNRTAPYAEIGLDLGQYSLGEKLEVTVTAWEVNSSIAVSVNERSVSYQPPINASDRFWFQTGDYSGCSPCGTPGQSSEVWVSSLTTAHYADS